MKNQHDPAPALGGALPALDSAGRLQPRADERVTASSGSEAEGEPARFYELRRLAEDWLDALRDYSKLTPEDNEHRELLIGWASGMSRAAMEDDIAELKLTRPKNSWKTATQYLRKRARDTPAQPEEGLPKWWGFGDDVTKAYGFHTIDDAEAFARAGGRVRGPGYPEQEPGPIVTDDAGRRFELLEDDERVEVGGVLYWGERAGGERLSRRLGGYLKNIATVAVGTAAGVAAAITTNGNEWSGP
tara:strand:+ start:205 stop:939 length:735 start_codon:yes stop_codon:yes gene_type:complete